MPQLTPTESPAFHVGSPSTGESRVLRREVTRGSGVVVV